MVLRRDRGRQLVQVDGGRIQGDGCGLCVCVAVGCGMCLCVFLLQGGRDASNAPMQRHTPVLPPCRCIDALH